jgi:hypothetical protein
VVKAKKKAKPKTVVAKELRFRAQPELIEKLQQFKADAKSYWAEYSDGLGEARAVIDRYAIEGHERRDKQTVPQAPIAAQAWLWQAFEGWPKPQGMQTATYAKQIHRQMIKAKHGGGVDYVMELKTIKNRYPQWQRGQAERARLPKACPNTPKR